MHRIRVRGVIAASSFLFTTGCLLASGPGRAAAAAPVPVAPPWASAADRTPALFHRPAPVPRHTERRAVAVAVAPLAVDPRGYAMELVFRQGWSAGQWSCLDALWQHESGWSATATNYSSGAYGIPQSLPASKLAAAGPDWRTDPLTQVRWGVDYIAQRYGSPCAALSNWAAFGSY